MPNILKTKNEHEAPPVLPWTQGDWWGLSAVAGMALAIRMSYFALVHREFWFSHPLVDSVNYDIWARAILHGDWLGHEVFAHSPLYAFILAGAYFLAGGPNLVAVAGIQLALGAAGCGLVYLLARCWFPRPAAFAAGLLGAAYGAAVFHEGTLLTVLLIHLLNLSLLLAAFWAANRGRTWNWIFPGALLGLSILARPNALLLLPVLALWIWLQPNRAGQGKKVWGPMLALALSALVVVAPATLRNRVVLHEWLFTVGNGGLNTYLGNYRQASGYHIPTGDLGLSASEQVRNAKRLAEQMTGRNLTYGQSSSYWLSRALDDITADPGRWAKLEGRKLLLLLNYYEYTTSANYYLARSRTPFLQWPWLSFAAVAPLALAGLWLFRRRWLELFPLYGMVAAYAFSNLSMLVSSEYRYGLMPAFFIFAGAAAVEFFQLAARRKWRVLVVPVALLCVGGVITQVDATGKPLRAYHLATAHANLAMVYAGERDFAGAAREFAAAHTLLLDRPEYRGWLALQLGNAYMQAGQSAAALAPLEEAHRLVPDGAQAANDYANALTANGRFAEALALRQELLRGHEADAQYWMNYGITSLWAGDARTADRAFARAASIQPSLATTIAHARAAILATKVSGSKKF
jgi:Tfp pilus assembly protein PilF